MTGLREHVDRELIAALVGKNLGACPVTGKHVLDARTCVVLRDADGDPAMVISQEAYHLLDHEDRLNPQYSRLATLRERHGLTVDRETVAR